MCCCCCCCCCTLCTCPYECCCCCCCLARCTPDDAYADVACGGGGWPDGADMELDAGGTGCGWLYGWKSSSRKGGRLRMGGRRSCCGGSGGMSCAYAWACWARPWPWPWGTGWLPDGPATGADVNMACAGSEAMRRAQGLC